ncbi:hypothetical protein [Candidatus Bodocaedibacter vickermanii]|uniref:Uncharacterized protein n=1 Tax=Candidatus Bodocaedibacter vickermanii TaxID=2741701 RepID=A0A7L9RRP0_9PROT|nr:hypothetical protein CPBP_00025 [Candidatus Paracaedibacteraceae bacterium 'Lake Konstanz']
MCTCVDLYLYVLFLCSVEKESTWRLGILVPMGGASTLGVFLAALTKIFTWWKEGKTSDATIQIQKSWNNIFSNPQEKTFLVKTLTQYWVSKNLPDSSAILRKIFLTANTTQQLYAELQKLNTPLSTSDAATIN